MKTLLFSLLLLFPAMGQTISGLSYSTTDSTIVGTWTTNTSANSNITCGGKNGIDNGVAASSTSHQAIVPGLINNTVYSCTVTSGSTTSSPQNVKTLVAQTRIRVTSASMGSNNELANSSLGDTFRSFVSNDGFTYMTEDDGNGFKIGTTTSANTQIGKITDENALTGTQVSLSNYGPFNTTNGTDGPGGAAMTNKSTGLFGLNGNLHAFVYRQFPPTYSTNRYANWIKSTNHGATWNNFTAVSTFTANGNPVTPNSPAEPIQFYDLTIGLVTPILYAADDGTLGYNTAGNQIDGANAYVYCTFLKDTTPLYLLRIPRIQFDAQTSSAFEYWVGPQSPAVADFVNDANWSASPTSATVILSGAATGAWFQIAFVPSINSYILTTWSSGGGTNFTFYSAPTPAGPWNLFFSKNNPTSGMHWYGPFPFHRDLIGNVLTNNIPVRIVYQGELNLGHYRPNWATLTLSTTPLPGASNTFVQGDADTSGQPSQNFISKAFPSSVTKGDLLVITWRRASSGAVTSVDDNMGSGNVWTVVYDTSMSGATHGWAYTFTNATGVCTVTVHLSTSSVNALSAIGEWSGPNAVRATAAMRLQSSINLLVSNSITVHNGDLMLGVFSTANGGTSFTASGTGWTGREVASITSTKWLLLSDNLSASAGSQTATATCAGSQTGLGSGIAAFYYLPPAGGVSPFLVGR
jgi:hypothetical protein